MIGLTLKERLIDLSLVSSQILLILEIERKIFLQTHATFDSFNTIFYFIYKELQNTAVIWILYQFCS